MSIQRKAVGIWGSVVLSSVAMGLAGCESSEAQSADKSAEQIAAHAAPLTGKHPGCNGGAFVVQMADVHCPEGNINHGVSGGKWLVEPICGGADDLPKPLQGYCSVTWVPNDPIHPQAPPTKGPELPNAIEDCMVNAAQSGSPMEVAGPALNQKLRSAAGALFDTTWLGPPAQPTSVFVLDTLPKAKVPELFGANTTSQTNDQHPFGRDEHGWLTLSLIRDLTSYDLAMQNSDVVELDAELALPNVDFTRVDTVDGGFSGRQFHLANAICKAIKTWKDATPNPVVAPAPVLVMALGSLPLEGQKCNSEKIIEQGSPAMRAVYYAMLHAACHGAALVAAAGNDPNGEANVPGCLDDSADVGAMCPGAMNGIPAPTRTQCAELYEQVSHYDPQRYKIYDPPSDPTKALDHPLVHMISAVDAAGALLPINRKDAESKLAAMGELGCAQDINGVWHAARTGTSIATAVAGAAFATLFAYRPGLTAAEAADYLYRSANTASRDRASSLDPSTTPDEMKVISICQALESALQLPNQLGCMSMLETGATTIVESAKLGGIGQRYVSDIESPDFIPSMTECPANWPLLSPAPGSTRCADCGYRLINSDDDSGTAYLRLQMGANENIEQLTIVLQGASHPSEAFVIRPDQAQSASATTLMLDISNSMIPASELRRVTFEAVVINDLGNRGAVSGEIPILRAP